MRILIVDDEPLARDRLRRLCSEIPDAQIVGEAGDGANAVNTAAEMQPDVVLLDVRMPGMNGLEAARHIATQEPAPAIIFTTAYDDYALQAFHVHAVGYLLKPIEKDKLQQALYMAARPNKVQLSAIKAADGKPVARTHISARVRGNIVLIPINEVYYFQADQKYVTVRHEGGEVLIEEALKELEEEFSAQFVRIHRNALICLNRVQGLERDALGRSLLTLRGIGDKLEVSRRHLTDLRATLKHL